MDDVLYFGTSKADSGTFVEEDPTVAGQANVKNGYLFMHAKSHEWQVGTMPVNEDKVIELNPKCDKYWDSHTYLIPEGYHSGNGKVYVKDLEYYTSGSATADEIAFNKVAWVNGQRVVGTLDMSMMKQEGTATDNDLAEGKIAWVNGNPIVGTLIRHSRDDKTLLAGDSYTIPAGIHSGTAIISAATLASQTKATAKAETILKGANAWVNGKLIQGTYDNVEATAKLLADATATKAQVLSGKTFYSTVYKAVVEGEMVDHTGESPRIVKPGEVYMIPEGYYNGLTAVKGADLSAVTVADAAADDIIMNKTAWVNGVEIVGTMPYNDSKEINISSGDFYTIPQGYHSGTGIIRVATLKSETPGNAIDSDIMNGKTAWVNGEKVIGTMPILKPVEATILAGEHFHIEKGYHDGSGWIWAEGLAKQTPGNLTTDVIRDGYYGWSNGKMVIGVMTNNPQVILSMRPGDNYIIPEGYHDGTSVLTVVGLDAETQGTAADDDILAGKTAWVNGIKVTGTLALSGNASPDDVPAGYTFYNTDAKQIRVGTLTFDGNATSDKVMKGYTFYSNDPKNEMTGTMELTGDAIASQVVSGYTFYRNDPTNKITGTMASNSPETILLETLNQSYTIPQGYHTGNGSVRVSIVGGNATAGDILKGKTAIANSTNLTGTLELTGTATANMVLQGQTFYSDNPKSKLTGTIVTQNASNLTLVAGSSQLYMSGYYPTTFIVSAQDLESQTPGTATSDDILLDKIAWVDGVELVGTIPTIEIVKEDWSLADNGDTTYSIVIPNANTPEITDESEVYTLALVKAEDDISTLDAGIVVLMEEATVTDGALEATQDKAQYLSAGDTFTIKQGYYDVEHVIRTYTLAHQTIGNATAAGIKDGQIAWVNGKKVTGTMPVRTISDMELTAGNSYTIQEGYYAGGTVIKAQSLDSIIGGSADASHVLAGQTVMVNGKEVTGTMPNIGSQTASINAGESVTITKGYHDGTGKVTGNSLASQTVGDATAANIFANKIAWVNGKQITGTMVDRAAVSATVNAGASYTIPAGYHNGSGKVTGASLASQTSADAVAANILTGKTAWVSGVKITGTMTNNGAVTSTINAGGTYTIPAGYHSGTGKVTGATLASQTSATATAAQILKSQTAWVNGTKITGTMTNNGAVTATISAGGSYTIPAGYHSGTGKVTASGLSGQTTATAAAAEILTGKTAWVNGVLVTGTMTNNGKVTKTINAGVTYTIPAGYHNGSGTVVSATLASQTAGTALAADILATKTAWVGGDKVTGVMINNGGVTATVNAGASYTIPKGYHDGTGKVTGNTLASQTSATATAAQILTNQTAWVNGTKITGTMANRGAVTATISAGGSYTIPAGYHSGAGKITGATLASQTSATATAANIQAGYTAWVNGVQITGTLASADSTAY